MPLLLSSLPRHAIDSSALHAATPEAPRLHTTIQNLETDPFAPTTNSPTDPTTRLCLNTRVPSVFTRQGKNHFTEVQCRSMVSLEDLVGLVTRGAPADLIRSSSRANENSTPADQNGDEEKQAGVRAGRPPVARSSSPSPTHDMAPGVSGSAEPIAVARSSSKPLDKKEEGAESTPVGPTTSSWFTAPSGLGVGVGRGDDSERPLPANVRWAFMCLLDSLFFSVKEPVEGLDRHPAVHALLEHLLAVRSLQEV